MKFRLQQRLEIELTLDSAVEIELMLDSAVEIVLMMDSVAVIIHCRYIHLIMYKHVKCVPRFVYISGK